MKEKNRIPRGFCLICERHEVADKKIFLKEKQVSVCGACKRVIEGLQEICVAKSGEPK